MAEGWGEAAGAGESPFVPYFCLDRSGRTMTATLSPGRDPEAGGSFSSPAGAASIPAIDRRGRLPCRPE